MSRFVGPIIFIVAGVITLVFHEKFRKATEETYKIFGWQESLHKGFPPLRYLWIFGGIVLLYIGITYLWNVVK